jgi:hypothetical protein
MINSDIIIRFTINRVTHTTAERCCRITKGATRLSTSMAKMTIRPLMRSTYFPA